MLFDSKGSEKIMPTPVSDLDGNAGVQIPAADISL
jgi:hypothetical protein